jgi:hypothetical protein
VTAGDLALVVAVVLCAIGFTALVVTLREVLRTLQSLRTDVDLLRAETRPLVAELRDSVHTARHDLDRFDRVLGSAEAISAAMESTGRVTRGALSTPVIKTVALATGSRRAASRLRRRKAG